MKTRALILAALLLTPCAHAQVATNGIQAQRHVAHESDLAANVVHLAPNQLGLADDAPTHIYRGTSAGNVLAIGSVGVTGQAGPQGVKGDNGQTGATGAQGTPGNTGATGPQGATGAAGPTGAAGTAGTNGTNGAAGATGPSGPNFPWSFLGNQVTAAPASINVTGAGATLSALNNALTLNVPGYILPAATTTTLGGIIAGAGLNISGNGTLSTVNNGTVTSVGLSLPGVLYSVSGSPVTGSGTLTASLLSQAANTILAAPDGMGGTPGFRRLVNADLPVPMVLTATGPNVVPLTIKAASGQTNHLFNLDSATTTGGGLGYFDVNSGLVILAQHGGNGAVTMDSYGRVYIDPKGTNASATIDAGLFVDSRGLGTTPLVVRALAGSTDNLIQFLDSTNVARARVDSNFNLVVPATLTALRTTTTTTTLTATDTTILANGTLTLTLPSAATAGAGHVYVIKDTGTGIVTVAGTVDGAEGPTLTTRYQYLCLICDGSAYWKVGGN